MGSGTVMLPINSILILSFSFLIFNLIPPCGIYLFFYFAFAER